MIGYLTPPPRPMPLDLNVIRPPAFIRKKPPLSHILDPLDAQKLPLLIMMPWLRTRNTTKAGNIVFTTAAYHPSSLLYYYDKLGGIEAFDSLWKPNQILPDIDWFAFPALAAVQTQWKLFLEWAMQKLHLPTAELDQAARLIADVFANGDLPFRFPSLEEKLKESELINYFEAGQRIELCISRIKAISSSLVLK